MNTQSVFKQYFATDGWSIFKRYFNEQYQIYMYLVVVLKLPESILHALHCLFITDTILCNSALRLAQKKERKVLKSYNNGRHIYYHDLQIENFQIGTITQINGRLIDFRTRTGTVYTWDDRYPKKTYSYPQPIQ